MNNLVNMTKQNEKESIKLMSFKEKAIYLSTQKRTWATLGAIAYAVGQKDYITALTNLFSFWG